MIQQAVWNDADNLCGTQGQLWVGDIYALASDAQELVGLGAVLGAFNAEMACFERCMLSAEAYRSLNALGDKYLHDLEPLLPRSRSVDGALSSLPRIWWR